MADGHITRDLLLAVARGKTAPRVLADLATSHLIDLCPFCRQEIAAFRSIHFTAEDYRQTFAAVHARLKQESLEIEAEKRRAERWFRELLAVPKHRQLARIERAQKRYRGRAFADRLIRASKAALPGDPEASYHFAHLAKAVIYHTDGRLMFMPPFAQAVAWEANARRAQGDLIAAEQDFAVARHIVDRPGVEDTLIVAEIDRLEGTLRKDQRRFAEALALLTHAIELYRVVGEEIEAAKVLLKVADCYDLQDEPEKAAEATYAALAFFDPDATPQLYLGTRHNLAWFLSNQGEHQHARDLLLYDEDLYRDYADRSLRLRRPWLEGRIALGLGEMAAAERLLEKAREGFARRRIGFDVAGVSLDLALVYLHAGRLDQVKAVAAEAVTLFAAQEVHRDALAALTLFREAALTEQVSVAMVRRLQRYLAQAKADPAASLEAVM